MLWLSTTILLYALQAIAEHFPSILKPALQRPPCCCCVREGNSLHRAVFGRYGRSAICQAQDKVRCVVLDNILVCQTAVIVLFLWKNQTLMVRGIPASNNTTCQDEFLQTDTTHQQLSL